MARHWFVVVAILVIAISSAACGENGSITAPTPPVGGVDPGNPFTGAVRNVASVEVQATSVAGTTLYLRVDFPSSMVGVAKIVVNEVVVEELSLRGGRPEIALVGKPVSMFFRDAGTYHATIKVLHNETVVKVHDLMVEVR